MVIGTRQQLAKVNIEHISVDGTKIKPSVRVRDLGAWFDTQMNMECHVSKTCSAAFYHLYNIRRIRKYLDIKTTETLIHAFVTSRIDYCNSLLYNMPSCLIQKIQRVQNAAARLVSGTSKYSRITPILFDLHWLPVIYRIHFKILILTFKAIHGTAPAYLQEMVKRKEQGRYSLRSTDGLILDTPTFKSLRTLGDRSFTMAAPVLWNGLPQEIRNETVFDYFKNDLKTHLFKLAFNVE